MTTESIDSTARSVVLPFMESTHPTGLSTTSAAIAKKMAPEKLKVANQLIISAIRSEFAHDSFSADIAEYAFREAFNETRVDIFSAILKSEGSNFGEEMRKTAESKENLAVIQGTDDFNLSVRPLHPEFIEHAESQRVVRDRLKAALNIDVIPTASAASWLAAISWIRRLPKETNKATEQLKGLLGVEKPTRDLLAVIEDIKLTFSKISEVKGEDANGTNAIRGVVCDVAKTVGATNEEREVAAITGSFNERVVWEKIVGRFEAMLSRATVLTDYRGANELASTSSYVADFSIELKELKPAAFEFAAEMSTESTVGVLTAFGTDAKKFNIDEDVNGKHLAALVAHIFLYAGVPMNLTNKGLVSGQNLDRPSSAIPLEWNILYPLISRNISGLWKCFLPKLDKLKFYLELSAKAGRKASTPIAVDQARPELIKLLRSDMQNVVNAVRDLATEGQAIDIRELINKANANVVRYTDEVVTPFSDQQLTVITGVNDFVRHPRLVTEAIRMLGVVAHPMNSGEGFAEGGIAYDLNRFKAVTSDFTMEEVGELYNRVSDFTTVSASSLDLSLDVHRALSAAMHDSFRKLRRVSQTKATTVMASEVVKNSSFGRLGQDFFAMVERTDSENLLLASGGASVKLTQRTIGNIHGSIAFGKMEPRHERSLSSHFDKCVIEAIDVIMNEICDAYIVNQVEVVNKTTATIDLKETNESYDKRLSKIGEAFTEYEGIDKQLLYTMAGTPLLLEGVGKVLTPEMVRYARGVQPGIRPHAQGIIKLIADRHATALTDTYAEKSINLFIRSLTTVLDEQDRMEAMKPMYRETIKALSANIMKTVDGKSQLLTVVYIMELFRSLTEKLSDKEA